MRLQQARPMSNSARQPGDERDRAGGRPSDPGGDQVPRVDREGFRPDLEGLRGVAILAVLVFHAGLPAVAGGFIGVDVFYVLSGFLITGLLLREVERHGRVDLKAFYARRARRLLPAAAVSLLGILALSWLLLPPLEIPRVTDEIVAAAASFANIRFALEANDYFATDITRSPVLHFWSLGVEEQFYLVWPAVLILAARFARPRRGAVVALGLILVASYVLALALTKYSPAWAFYSLPTRAWQLALGGLLAAGAPQLARVPARLAVPIGWLGLASVLASVVVISPSVPYPGFAALLPSVGAAGLILAGTYRGSPGAILATAPLRFLGRISYSLYLVHWPILVLPAATVALGRELPLTTRVALAGVSVVAGYASWRWVEQPFHRGRRILQLRPSRALALAGAAIAVTIVVSTVTGWVATRRLDDPNAGPPITAGVGPPPAGVGPRAEPPADQPPGPGGEEDGTPVPGESLEPLPSGSPAPTVSVGPGATPAPSPSPTPYRPIALPNDVQPKLTKVRADVERLNRDHCTLQHLDVQPRDCIYGNAEGTVTMALVGDSHAAQWFPALERIATERGWRLLVETKVSCRFMDMPHISIQLKREYTECTRWRDLVVDRLAKFKPDLVVVSLARAPRTLTAADGDPKRQGEALGRILERIPGKKAIIVDTPLYDADPPACISAHVGDVLQCGLSWKAAFGWRHLILERTAADATGATLVDLSTVFCPDLFCQVVIGDYIAFRDYQHLTATYADALADEVAARLPPIGNAAAAP